VRIPFPERIPIDRVAVAAVLLFLIQSLEKTPLYFSAGCAAFLLIAALAFNTAGGLSRASGAYVFFFAVLVVILGLGYKALLGEPADSNLRDPQTTIEVYVGAIAAMLLAVVVSRRMARKSPLLQNVLKESDMYRSCIGCIVFGIGGVFILALLGNSGVKLIAAFNQLNDLVPLAVIIGVMYEVRRSGGARSVNFPVVFAAAYLFLVYGLFGFSKAGLLLPFFCWLLPVCAMRYRLSALQLGAGLLGAFIMFQYLVPYSQYGRRFLVGNQTYSQRLQIAIRLLAHPETTRELYEEGQEENTSVHYYNKAEGFWDRLQFIAVDDSLIDLTDQGSIYGLGPIRDSFINAVPHFILADKPVLNFGNTYAHELGGLSEDDTTTGISFSPASEAYHLQKWWGVLVVAPLIWMLLFIVLDSLFGDLRTTPWGLLVLSSISHTAPEAGITGAIYMVTYGVAIFTFSAFFAAWIAPTCAIVVLGRDRRKARRPLSFRPTLAPPTPG